MVSMVEKLGVRGKKCVECVVCPLSVLNVVRFAAERLRARPIGFSVRVSMVSLPAPGPLVPEARIIPRSENHTSRPSSRLPNVFLFIQRREQIQ